MELIDRETLIKDLKTSAIYHANNTHEETLLYRDRNIVREQPTVEAIPKDQYEQRLKAEKVAMLEDLKKEMNPIKECEYQIYGKEHWNFVGKCQDVIQQKINALRGTNE